MPVPGELLAKPGSEQQAARTFEATQYRPRTVDPVARVRLRRNQLETTLEPHAPPEAQWPRVTARQRVATADRIQKTSTFIPMDAVGLPLGSPYVHPEQLRMSAKDGMEPKYVSVSKMPGWQPVTAASALQTRVGPVPRLDLSRTGGESRAAERQSKIRRPAETERRPLTERAARCFTPGGRAMSRRLEHRLRDTFIKSDGASGLPTFPARSGAAARRWARLEHRWEEVERERRGRNVPINPQAWAKTLHATRDFRSDSIFSASRRPDDVTGERGIRTRGRHMIVGGAPIQDTSSSIYGNFAGGLETERPCTAGIRIKNWNYHWQTGPSAVSAR